VSHGTCSYIFKCINAVASSVMYTVIRTVHAFAKP